MSAVIESWCFLQPISIFVFYPQALTTDLMDTKLELQGNITSLTKRFEELQRNVERLVDVLGGAAGGVAIAESRIVHPQNTNNNIHSSDSDSQEVTGVSAGGGGAVLAVTESLTTARPTSSRLAS